MNEEILEIRTNYQTDSDDLYTYIRGLGKLENHDRPAADQPTNRRTDRFISNNVDMLCASLKQVHKDMRTIRPSEKMLCTSKNATITSLSFSCSSISQLLFAMFILETAVLTTPDQQLTPSFTDE